MGVRSCQVINERVSYFIDNYLTSFTRGIVPNRASTPYNSRPVKLIPTIRTIATIS